MASDNPSALLQLATAAEEVERASGDIPTPAEDTTSAEISPRGARHPRSRADVHAYYCEQTNVCCVFFR